MVRLLICLGVIFLALMLVFSLPFFRIPPLITAAIYVILLVLGLAIYASFTAGQKIESYILAVRYQELSADDHKQIFKLACRRMLPMWLCVVAVSIIPLTQWEVWAMLCLPCVVLYGIAAKAVFRNYHMLTGDTWRYWTLQIGVFVAIQVSFQCIVRIFV
ncbi:MAG: hypothetical protein IJW40_08335 [Clostridia bacterium]|nr:hypothetical protein [Clostridia bacterium]